jgi:hypothetical protein
MERRSPILQDSITPIPRLICCRCILNFDSDVDPRRQVKLFEFIHRFGSGFDNIDEALVRALLEGLLRFLVRMRGALDGEALDAGRERDRAGHTSAGAFDGVRDIAGRLVNDPVVKSLQSNADALSSHTKNNCLLMVLLYFVLPSGETEGGI